jgi:hypothetical protein
MTRIPNSLDTISLEDTIHRDQRSQVGIKAVVVRRWQTLLSNLAIVCCILGTTDRIQAPVGWHNKHSLQPYSNAAVEARAF